MSNRKDRGCPICSTKQETKANFLYEDERFSIAKCFNCNHVYLLNPRDETASAFNAGADMINNYKRRHLQILRLLQDAFGDKKAHICEIGSGYGQLGKLIDLRTNYDYLGFEISDGRAEYCIEHGVNVKKEFFAESEDTYDAVIIDNVLEHVTEPKEIIRTATNSLKDGGMVIVIVPNINDIRRFLPKWRKRHYWQPHCHLSYFSFRDLKRLFSEFGMEAKNFGVNTVGSKKSLLYGKTLIDNAGINCLGLYVYAMKKSVKVEA